MSFRDSPFYVLAALVGIATGYADVLINDLLFTALLVLAGCMFFGLLRPRRPWRWVIVVAFFVPASEFAAYLLTSIQPTRAQIYGSVLTVLPGIAGAYGGSLMRNVLDNLRQGR
jgi:ABC-type multidrug transport system permease subunit